jgi:hypothetical protein
MIFWTRNPEKDGITKEQRKLRKKELATCLLLEYCWGSKLGGMRLTGHEARMGGNKICMRI